MSCLSATLTNALFAYLCICVFVFMYLQVRHPGTLFLRSLYHHLSENIWFVWSKTSYSGDKRRCYQAGRTTNDEQWKIVLLSLWAVGRLSFAIFPDIMLTSAVHRAPLREGFRNASHENCQLRREEYPLSINFFALTFRKNLVR